MTTSQFALDFRFLLLDSYKKLGLSEEDVMVCLMIDHLLKQGNRLVTADLLALKMNRKAKEIDATMVGLVKRNYLEYEVTGGEMRTSLKPLETKLYAEFEKALTQNRQNLNAAERNAELSELYAYFEKRLARALSPIEKEFIANWLDDAYGVKTIKDALEDALAAGKKTIKSIDKILRSNRAREDISKEGYTGVSSRWSADIERTIEIAKTKWVKDDDED